MADCVGMERVGDAASPQPRADRSIARLAAKQNGVFSRKQALHLGATRGVIEHRLRSGRWERLTRDVFVVAGSPSTWLRSLTAAILAWGDDVAASHRAAAAIRGLLGCSPGAIEVTVPRGRRRDGPGLVHRIPLDRIDFTIVHGIPVTTPARTLIDLTSVLPSTSVEEILDDTVARGMVSLPLLRRRFEALARPGRPGTAAMRRLLTSRDPAIATPTNVFERRLMRLLLRAGLPLPASQFEVRAAGRLIAVPDFAYPDLKLAIEADGYRWHAGRSRWDSDRARHNRLTLLGWRLIHVTWTDLTRRPSVLVETVRAALAGEPV